MNVIDWLNEKHKNTDFWDTGFTKAAVFFFTLMLVKFFPTLTSFEWYLYLIVAIVLAIRPLYHIFGKNKK